MSAASEAKVTPQRDGQKPDTETAGAETKANASQMVVVDLGRRQSKKRIKRLRKGRGKLADRVDKIVADLVEAGTFKAGVQPVVIVVREKPGFPTLF
jgi:hypothetical protein